MNTKISIIYPLKWMINYVTLPCLLMGLPPSYAATFSTISRTSFIATNFNQIPQNVGTILDVNAINIAEVGLVGSSIEIDSVFAVEDSSVVARSDIFIETLGTGEIYQQNINVYLTFLGQFFIPANNFLSFDFQGSMSLFNLTNNLLLNPVSTSSYLNFLFYDISNNQVLDVIEIVAASNTNSKDDFNQDLFKFAQSPYTQLAERQDFVVFEDNEELVETFFSGSYSRYFQQDTQLTLVIASQSCNYASNTLDVCVRVPEPSSNLMIFLSSFIISIRGLTGRIMKQIIKFTI
ncbi:hypothetical protein PCC8801_3276 [Rippkaea orientalis PCC 8801]|uniref:Uncharacterized protein n=1 Tax=Rippkaea orientalis (strain PCC 8801 / RF-1) TaxID=41431 RepID=B7JYE7_RIPO1|nr:hypothetical protein [Rippkaea orientalis]ACK67249.1 hypothetical protein PCC8801_3276 [Rippkaea orientalis PCC 8801]